MFTELLEAGLCTLEWYNDDLPCPGLLPGVCLAHTTDNFLSSPPSPTVLSKMEPGLTDTFRPPGLPWLVMAGEAKL